MCGDSATSAPHPHKYKEFRKFISPDRAASLISMSEARTVQSITQSCQELAVVWSLILFGICGECPVMDSEVGRPDCRVAIRKLMATDFQLNHLEETPDDSNSPIYYHQCRPPRCLPASLAASVHQDQGGYGFQLAGHRADAAAEIDKANGSEFTPESRWCRIPQSFSCTYCSCI